jgi:hypothetical protein
VGDLQDLRLRLERVPPVGAEEAGLLHAELRVALRIQHVTLVARASLEPGNVVHEEVAPRLLMGGERVVERADRVRRVRYLQDEVRERLHVGGRDGAPRPSKASNATMNFPKAAFSSNVPLSGCALGASLPPVLSPRQCMGPWLAMPRKLCVDIGPFMGTKSGFWSGSPLIGPGFVKIVPSGLPRSHARPSKSPDTWQLAHEESPRLEVSEAS